MTFVIILLSFTAVAQTTQKGIVQEYNEKAKKTPLSGVELRAKAAQSAVSAKDGTFQLQFLTLNPGDRINVSSIEKLGYEIFNKEAVKQWNLNPNTPFVIVMCRSDKFKKIRDNYEAIASENYNKQYKKEIANLNKLKAEGKIKDEEYRNSLQEIKATYDKQLENLNTYVERFARIDLSELSDQEQEIIELVQQGRFDEAIARYDELNYKDKYIQQLSDINQVSSAINQLTDLKKVQLQAKDSLLAAVSRQIETLMLVGNSENWDKIRNLYVDIAEADSTNVSWILKTGEFLVYSDFDVDATELAISYYKKALNWSINQFGLEHADVEELHFHLGEGYWDLGDWHSALDFYKKGFSVVEKLYGMTHPKASTYCTNIGTLYSDLGDLDSSLEWYMKALEIDEEIYGPEHPEVARSHKILGICYLKREDYSAALESYKKGLAILEKVYGTDYYEVTDSYESVGEAYYKQGNYDSALDWYYKSFTIQDKVVGKFNDPDLFNTIIKLSDQLAKDCLANGEYKKALDYFNKELAIKEKTFPQNDPGLAYTYQWIGFTYEGLEDFNSSIEYHKKALNIFEKTHFIYNSNEAYSNWYIGSSYQAKGEYTTALEYFQKVWKICERDSIMDRQLIINIFSDAYQCFTELAKEDAQYAEIIKEFMADKTWIMTVDDNDCPAKQAGLSNEYYILEYNNWNAFNGERLFDINVRSRGKPIDIVIMKDGNISKHHFEDKIGVVFNIFPINPEDLQKIKILYQNWKSSQ